MLCKIMNADRMGGEAGFAPMWRPVFEGGGVGNCGVFS
jgi:hypothetical protein